MHLRTIVWQCKMYRCGARASAYFPFQLAHLRERLLTPCSVQWSAGSTIRFCRWCNAPTLTIRRHLRNQEGRERAKQSISCFLLFAFCHLRVGFPPLHLSSRLRSGGCRRRWPCGSCPLRVAAAQWRQRAGFFTYYCCKRRALLFAPKRALALY
jgi:hypothetical protein